MEKALGVRFRTRRLGQATRARRTRLAPTGAWLVLSSTSPRASRPRASAARRASSTLTMGQLWASPVVEVMERIISLRHGLYLPAEARARPAPGLEVEGSGVIEVRAKSIPARGDRARFLGVPGVARRARVLQSKNLVHCRMERSRRWRIESLSIEAGRDREGQRLSSERGAGRVRHIRHACTAGVRELVGLTRPVCGDPPTRGAEGPA